MKKILMTLTLMIGILAGAFAETTITLNTTIQPKAEAGFSLSSISSYSDVPTTPSDTVTLDNFNNNIYVYYKLNTTISNFTLQVKATPFNYADDTSTDYVTTKIGYTLKASSPTGSEVASTHVAYNQGDGNPAVLTIISSGSSTQPTQATSAGSFKLNCSLDSTSDLSSVDSGSVIGTYENAVEGTYQAVLTLVYSAN
ncbi:MAG: hypothetical protein LKE40_13760 [Spirochaetia bacterium]|jgi:hypothetical protein|nr:hypothetical protein [Spirochaetia bacterium]